MLGSFRVLRTSWHSSPSAKARALLWALVGLAGLPSELSFFTSTPAQASSTLATSLAPMRTSSFGVRNPQIRLCILSQGQFGIRSIGSDEWAVCTYASTLIDTLSLLAWIEARSTLALTALQDEAALASAPTCEALGGRTIRGPKEDLCVWSDFSMLSMNVLGSSQPAQASRKELAEALGKL